jgi:hypothetical protein
MELILPFIYNMTIKNGFSLLKFYKKKEGFSAKSQKILITTFPTHKIIFFLVDNIK